MLGRLMKYEIPAVGRRLVPLYAAWAAAAILLGLALSRISTGENFFIVLSAVVYVAVTTAIFVMAIVLIIQRYKNSLLGDQGYFTHVLPVSTTAHIFNKLLTAMLWVIITYIVAAVTGVVITLFSGNVEILRSFLEGMIEELINFFSMSPAERAQIVVFVIEILLVSLAGSAKTILQIYAALTIGHQARDKVTLASIGAFIGLITAESIIVRLCIIPAIMLLDKMGDSLTAIEIFLGLGLLVSLAISTAYFLICRYLMKEKLNLA